MSMQTQPTTQGTLLTGRTDRRPVRRTPTRRGRWRAEVGWEYPVAVVIIFSAMSLDNVWRLIMPLVIPVLAVVGLLTAFGDFILAKIVLTSEDNWTLAVGMYQWVSNQLTSRWGLFAAGAVIASIPVLVLFLALRRYIVGGLTQGAVKG